MTAKFNDRLRPTTVSLQNASGEQITCIGEVDLQIGVARRNFNWSFVIAEVTRPILGIDFLKENNLIIDVGNRLLTDPKTGIKINLTADEMDISTITGINICAEVSPPVKSILDKYPSLTTPLQLAKTNEKVEITAKHEIDTKENNPVYCRPRPLTGKKLAAAKQEFTFLLDAGIIRYSKSPWASPIHMVKKGDSGKYRIVGDYRSLNAITENDKYPIPHLRTLLMSLHGKTVFSKIDLERAFLQIPMAEEDIPKTAVTTPFGLFEYKFMPFGLKNAGSTFQRFMDQILGHIPNASLYLDDILLASESEESHMKDLEEVFKILAEYGLKINIEKCKFAVDKLTFLGYEVSADGIKPPSDRVEAISNCAKPTSSTELRRFMGMINFFRPMIPDAANISLGLTELLKNHPKSKTLPWSDEAEKSFNALKQALIDCPTLKFPSPEASDYHIVTDSSNYAVGAALYQIIDTNPCPVAFYSKKLSESQRTLSTYERELLAAFLAIVNFKVLIDGHTVTLFTDHKPIVSAFYSKNTAKSEVQQRQLSFISEYVHKVHYIKGHYNVVADFMSRPFPVSAITVEAYDLHNLAIAQANDEEIDQYKERLQQFKLDDGNELWCENTTEAPRPFVPKDMRNQVIAFLHNLSHPGAKKTSKIVKMRYFWPGMDKSIKYFCKHCSTCQKSKVHKHTSTPVQQIAPASDRFETVHLDIIGPMGLATLPNLIHPLPFKYVLTCIDRATRWCEAIPLIDTTANSVAIAFLSGWVSRFGVPLHVITDRGSQFEAELFNILAKMIGFVHLRTTSYHPQGNGLLERWHRTLKASIMARQENWYYTLPIVLLGLRMAPHEAGFAPFTAVTGAHSMLPQPLIIEKEIPLTTPDIIQTLIKEMSNHRALFQQQSSGTVHGKNKEYVPNDLSTSKKVWLRIDRIRKPLEAPYTGPFEVLKREQKYFTLQLPRGPDTVHIDRLKPYYESTTTLTSNDNQKQSPNRPQNSTLLSESPVSDTNLTAENHTDDQCNHSTSQNNTHTPQQTDDNLILPRHSRAGRMIKFSQYPEFKYY